MSIYIARRRKTSNALDTLVLSEQECFQWTSERLVATRPITEVSWQQIPNHCPATAKDRWPSELSQWRGTRSWWRLAERSRCLLAMSEAGVTQSIRYCGALCCWHRCTVTLSLYCTRSGTSSQCRSTCSRRDRPRSNMRVPLTRRAAAFSTRWSLSAADLGAPASTELQLQLCQSILHKHQQSEYFHKFPLVTEFTLRGLRTLDAP